MGGVVRGILVWQEGGEFVLLLIAIGAVALGSARARRDGADHPGHPSRRVRLGAPGSPPDRPIRRGLGLPVPQLNNYILAPIEEVRVSEAAGVNSAGQSFGLSFGLAVAGGLLLAALSLSFIDMTQSSDVIPPPEQELIADALEDNAQLVSTQLEELLADQPDEIRDEIVRINSDAGNLALQVAMLVPILACLFGFINAFRVMRLPDYKPSAAIEGLVGG